MSNSLGKRKINIILIKEVLESHKYVCKQHKTKLELINDSSGEAPLEQKLLNNN